ncbi:MAG: AMP-binding protein [Sinimarinibacterium sp.]|jgi:bile acid-coenzyme A ligase
MTTPAAALYTPGRRLAELAASRPQAIAVRLARADGEESTLSFGELHRASNRLARLFAARGVSAGAFVAIHLPNSLEHFIATAAAYKLGACPMPLSPKLPAPERDGLLALGAPAAIVADDPALAGITRVQLADLSAWADDDVADAIPAPFKAIASGGSTGKPKLIVAPGAFHFPVQNPFTTLFQFRDGDLVYSPGPLYHNQPFFLSQLALFSGASALINERFDAAQALALIERHRPAVVSTVPTMLARMLRVPDVATRDLSGISVLWHMAAPCPDWVKRGWIERIGAEKVWEMWGATENVGATIINGAQWLKKPGSVGKGMLTELRIVDERGQALPPGEVGEIYARFGGAPPNYAYRGSAPAPTTADGFASVGDLGYLDADGYLYLADRRVDLILSGGANVYPAEVESVLSEHPGVADVVVVGLRDDDLGRRVHAIIEPADAATPPAVEALDRLVRSRIAAYKVPRSYEFLARLPRDESGKIRRRALREERDAAS